MELYEGGLVAHLDIKMQLSYWVTNGIAVDINEWCKVLLKISAYKVENMIFELYR